MYRIQYLSDEPHKLLWQETSSRLPKAGERFVRHDIDEETEIDGLISDCILSAFDHIEGIKSIPLYYAVVESRASTVKGTVIWR